MSEYHSGLLIGNVLGCLLTLSFIFMVNCFKSKNGGK